MLQKLQQHAEQAERHVVDHERAMAKLEQYPEMVEKARELLTVLRSIRDKAQQFLAVEQRRVGLGI